MYAIRSYYVPAPSPKWFRDTARDSNECVAKPVSNDDTDAAPHFPDGTYRFYDDRTPGQ